MNGVNFNPFNNKINKANELKRIEEEKQQQGNRGARVNDNDVYFSNETNLGLGLVYRANSATNKDAAQIRSMNANAKTEHANLETQIRNSSDVVEAGIQSMQVLDENIQQEQSNIDEKSKLIQELSAGLTNGTTETGNMQTSLTEMENRRDEINNNINSLVSQTGLGDASKIQDEIQKKQEEIKSKKQELEKLPQGDPKRQQLAKELGVLTQEISPLSNILTQIGDLQKELAPINQQIQDITKGIESDRTNQIGIREELEDTFNSVQGSHEKLAEFSERKDQLSLSVNTQFTSINQNLNHLVNGGLGTIACISGGTDAIARGSIMLGTNTDAVLGNELIKEGENLVNTGTAGDVTENALGTHKTDLQGSFQRVSKNIDKSLTNLESSFNNTKTSFNAVDKGSLDTERKTVSSDVNFEVNTNIVQVNVGDINQAVTNAQTVIENEDKEKVKPKSEAKNA